MNDNDERQLVERGLNLVEEAMKRDVVLRIIGAVAVRIHCSNVNPLHRTFDRGLSDIDFMGYKEHDKRIDRLFRDCLNFEAARSAITPGLYTDRKVYFDPAGKSPNSDVFFDKLSMNHEVDFRGRLGADCPTIPLPELVLTKLQIVQINEKDMKDLILLFAAHEVDRGGKEAIDMERISKRLAKDWGFYHTATTNLVKVKNLLSKYEVLMGDLGPKASDNVDKLLNCIEREPKSLQWKLRAKVGTKKKWYNPVEEVERADWLK